MNQNQYRLILPEQVRRRRRLLLFSDRLNWCYRPLLRLPPSIAFKVLLDLPLRKNRQKSSNLRNRQSRPNSFLLLLLNPGISILTCKFRLKTFFSCFYFILNRLKKSEDTEDITVTNPLGCAFVLLSESNDSKGIPGTVVCGVCGAVRRYSFILQARKFGTFSCEPCRKFISRVLRARVAVKCSTGSYSCIQPPAYDPWNSTFPPEDRSAGALENLNFVFSKNLDLILSFSP